MKTPCRDTTWWHSFEYRNQTLQFHQKVHERMKVLLTSFNLNGHSPEFRPQT